MAIAFSGFKNYYLGIYYRHTSKTGTYWAYHRGPIAPRTGIRHSVLEGRSEKAGLGGTGLESEAEEAAKPLDHLRSEFSILLPHFSF